MPERTPYFDLAARLARKEYVAYQVDAECDCRGQCRGHAREVPLPDPEAPTAIVDGARWALESVIRAALAKEAECERLRAKLLGLGVDPDTE